MVLTQPVSALRRSSCVTAWREISTGYSDPESTNASIVSWLRAQVRSGCLFLMSASAGAFSAERLHFWE